MLVEWPVFTRAQTRLKLGSIEEEWPAEGELVCGGGGAPLAENDVGEGAVLLVVFE